MHDGLKKMRASYSKSKYFESAVDYETEIVDEILKCLDSLYNLRFI